MSTDVMHLLREADPVVDQPHYDDTTLRSRIDAIIDTSTVPDSADATVVADWDRPPEVGRPHWIVGLAVAAVVAGLATTGLTIAHKHTTGAGRAQSVLACRVAGELSPARQAAARTVITDRITHAGGRVVSFRVDGQTIHFAARGVDARTVATACAPTSAALRPLIARPVPVNTTGPHSSTPLRGLGFDVPRSAAQLATLSPSQKARLTAAVARYDCSASGSAQAPAVALSCGPSTGARLVYLLGPALLTGNGVSSANAQEPNPTGNAQWTVHLRFSSSAQAAIADYTRQHSSTRAARPATACSAEASPCSDYLASVINNRVASAAHVSAPIRGVMETSGNFDRASATALADDLTAASIALTPATA